MPHSTYLFNNGQDANYPFTRAVPHFATPPFDPEPRFNADDPEFGSLSGDDDAEGLDTNAQLRSQQLNSDGTPKRPMNAFMIFARKRRPMVSSEQPTMRTGEISKILSKEWSEMRKEDKQFYLDQAKKLKDTFNTRWPDYVYRRRPNNSRKRRKLGGSPGAGPARDHDVTINSDGQLEAFVDPNASSQSGDESKSQFTASPLGAQTQLLYPPGELGHTHTLDRSPTPARASAGYTRAASSPYDRPIRPSYLEEPVINGFESRTRVYNDSGDVYYDCLPSSAGIHDHSPGHSTNKNWHPFDMIPSGVVGPTSTSTPNSSPLMHVAPQIQHLHITQAPSKWSKASPTNDAHPYEARSALWGASPLMAGPNGADGQGINATLLPSASGPHPQFAPIGSPHPNALGMHLHGGHEKDTFDDRHYQHAYIESGRFDRLAPEPHSTLTPPAFQGGLPGPQTDSTSTYFESNFWAHSERSG